MKDGFTNPVLSRGLGRKLKKEVLANMSTPTRSFNCHLEFKHIETKADGSLIIEGYASTKDIDRTGEVVEPTAFADALKDYMNNPIVTYMHDWYAPIGKTLDAKIDDNGLWVRVMIAKSAEKVRSLIIEGILKAFSIGYAVVSDKIVDEIYHIVKLKLMEIAVVTIPANQNCLFSLAKALERGTDLELTEDEMRRQIKENPAIRKEIEDELREKMRNEYFLIEMPEMRTITSGYLRTDYGISEDPPEDEEADFSLAPLGEVMHEYGALTERENEIAQSLESVVEGVVELVESGKL